MARSCNTCSLPPADLVAVHDAVDAGQSAGSVAAKYGLQKSSLRRHLEHRVRSSPTSPAAPVDDLGDDGDLLGRLRTLATRCDELLVSATDAGSQVVALRAVAEARLLTESMARLALKVEERRLQAHVDLRVLGAWRELRSLVMDELADHPDARERLAAALLRGEEARS